jgi:hypothetical protein
LRKLQNVLESFEKLYRRTRDGKLTIYICSKHEKSLTAAKANGPPKVFTRARKREGLFEVSKRE